MTSISFLSSTASTSAMSTVSVGTKITPDGLTTLSNVVKNIENTKISITTGTDLTFTAFNFNARFGPSFTSYN